MPKKNAVLSLLLLVALIVSFGDLPAQESLEQNHKAGGLILPSRILWQFGICPNAKSEGPGYYADFSFWAGARISKEQYTVSTAHVWDREDFEDWAPIPGTKKEMEKSLIPALKSGFIGQFTDIVEKKGHTPLGLTVKCESMGFDQKGYVIYRYTAMLKTGMEALDGFYLGVEVDVDVPDKKGILTPENDYLDILNNGSGLAFYDGDADKKTEDVLGISYLGLNPPNISSWGRKTEPKSDLEQYKVLSANAGFEKVGKGGNDWRFLISDGPYDLKPGESVSFTFAVGYAKGLEKLNLELDKADAMLAKHYPGATMHKAIEKPRFADAMLAGPTEFNLYPAYPNPFNNTVQIKYDLPDDSDINVSIYNMRGRKVKTLIDGVIASGIHQTQWSGKDEIGREVSSGVYFLVMRVGNKAYKQKLILTK
ncbi:T9SS type A sorting domain-containing protein [bacterium]|nr:T9SS type A sorting domain-containing protein [bacterium]